MQKAEASLEQSNQDYKTYESRASRRVQSLDTELQGLRLAISARDNEVRQPKLLS